MDRPSPAPTDRRHQTLDTIRFLVAGLALALIVRIVAVQPFTIPSSSMEPGLVTGDYIVVSKFAYGWSTASLPFDPPMRPGRLMGRTPARGDVVVFRRPSAVRGTARSLTNTWPPRTCTVSPGRPMTRLIQTWLVSLG
ncbi:signal peptidase I, partial [Rhodospirillum rubrum]|nr:signal peptidase I [Rhodospirillum rubrum]